MLIIFVQAPSVKVLDLFKQVQAAELKVKSGEEVIVGLAVAEIREPLLDIGANLAE
jgi:hypothetical protein